MDENSLIYLHALRLIPEVGNRSIGMLLKRFGGSQEAWQASDAAISHFADIRTEKIREALREKRKKIDPLQEWEKFRKGDIILLTPADNRYPQLLKEIPDRPETLYVRGAFDWSHPKPMLAIVGSRKFTPYGEQAALRLSEDLARAGLLVVSGLAFGIDSIAHRAALEAGGETIAVLPGGINHTSIAPQTHVPLAEKILRHGALVSECPPDSPVTAWAFPVRDRIIAGLTLGTLVIEAPEKSGSLITATCALEYNREVFAVPGSIFSPSSIGTNMLIKKGAKMVSSIQDILEELPGLMPARQEKERPSPSSAQIVSSEEEKVLALLSHEPLHVDKIIKAATLDTATVSSLLSILEIKRLAKNIGGMYYIKL